MSGTEPSPKAPATLHIVVMGVSGSGKTTLARAIAEKTGWQLQEADDLHPEGALEILQDGRLPAEHHRKKWLGTVRDWIAGEAAKGNNTVTACTALRIDHREILSDIEEGATVFYVHLYGTEDVLAERMENRVGDVDMPRELLVAQLEDLQRLTPGEKGIQLDVRRTPEQLLDDSLNAAMFAQKAYSS